MNRLSLIKKACKKVQSNKNKTLDLKALCDSVNASEYSKTRQSKSDFKPLNFN